MSVLEKNKNKEETISEKMISTVDKALDLMKIAVIKEAAHHEAAKMMADPQDALAKKIWNLPEDKRFKDFI